jgi:hypothetical protein
MSKQCECGCGESPVGGIFLPGHDQRLRKALEERVGGLLALRSLVQAAEAYAHGRESLHPFSDRIRTLFTPRPDSQDSVPR